MCNPKTQTSHYRGLAVCSAALFYAASRTLDTANGLYAMSGGAETSLLYGYILFGLVGLAPLVLMLSAGGGRSPDKKDNNPQ